MSGAKPKCPPHADIAERARVHIQTVRKWSDGQRRTAPEGVLAIADLTDAETAIAVLRQWEANRAEKQSRLDD